MAPFLTALFKRFHDKNKIWTACVQILTELDCLASLATASKQSGHVMCRPQFVEPKDRQSYLEVRQMVHPCVNMKAGKEFKANDTVLDPADNQALLLVTGPNMGGKSTLLR